MTKKETIKLFCEEYKNLYNLDVTPEIKLRRIKPVAYINGKEAYDGIYKIYVNRKYIAHNIVYMRAALYHEMTHIADSIIFKNLPYDEFLKIMSTYSEVHASEIEFEALLEYRSMPITPKTMIYSVITTKTIEDEIKGYITQFKLDFYSKTFNYLFYTIGKIRTLQKYGLDYEREFLYMISEFEFIHEYIKLILHSDDIDCETILKIFDILQEHRKHGDVLLNNNSL